MTSADTHTALGLQDSKTILNTKKLHLKCRWLYMCVSRSSKPWWFWSRLPYWVWRHLQKIAQALPYDPFVPLGGFAKSGMLSTRTMYIQSKWDIEFIWKQMQYMGNKLNDKRWWHLWWRLAKMSYQIWFTLGDSKVLNYLKVRHININCSQLFWSDVLECHWSKAMRCEQGGTILDQTATSSP